MALGRILWVEFLEFFKILKKVSEQTRLLDLGDNFYSRPKAESEQTMRLDPRETICLNTFYRF